MPSNTAMATAIELNIGNVNMSIQTSLAMGDTLSIQTDFSSASAPSIQLALLPPTAMSPLGQKHVFRKRAAAIKPQKVKKRARTSTGGNPDAVTSDCSDTEVSESDEVFYAATSLEDPKRPVRIIRRVVSNLPIVVSPRSKKQLIPVNVPRPHPDAKPVFIRPANIDRALALADAGVSLLGPYAEEVNKIGIIYGTQAFYGTHIFKFRSISTLEKLKLAGKYFKRAIHAYQDLRLVMEEGARACDWAGPTENTDTAIGPQEQAFREQMGVLFRKLLSHIEKMCDDLQPVLRHIYADHSDSWDQLVSKMKASAMGVRSDDTNGVKHETAYFLPNPSCDGFRRPVQKLESKSDRGLAHPDLRYLLLGWEDRQKLPAITWKAGDPIPGLDVLSEEGEQFSNRVYPSCFYEEGSWRANDITHGLFRGYMIVRNLRHTWTGPCTAISGIARKGIPLGCSARVHRQVEVIPEMVAYACCQARTQLQTSPWAERVGEYSYLKLYRGIIKLFTVTPDTESRVWAEDTLSWLQTQVFGDAVNPEDEEGSDDDDDVAELILKQRAAANSSSDD
ncbi:hypothetical protein GGX14DRAFT_395968 [Mycena pura]|uniref:Uncharacterized protein n=1 Tax=Mycena pura TaxID=153505 RepID=A0AAD6YE42_9AGAR|nr:hypothetical protein GGX14DRAFT_395968 [Mycena pura]